MSSSAAAAAHEELSKGPLWKEVDYKPLQDGITLLKFGWRGNAREKVITISGDLRYLKYQSKYFSHHFGSYHSIDFDRVSRIQKGQKTYQFTRLAHIFGLAKEKSLSIYYNDYWGNERTLDLLCPTPEIFVYIFKVS